MHSIMEKSPYTFERLHFDTYAATYINFLKSICRESLFKSGDNKALSITWAFKTSVLKFQPIAETRNAMYLSKSPMPSKLTLPLSEIFRSDLSRSSACSISLFEKSFFQKPTVNRSPSKRCSLRVRVCNPLLQAVSPARGQDCTSYFDTFGGSILRGSGYEL